MRHPGIDGQRLVGVGGCAAQELALGGDRQESRRHRKPKEREGKGREGKSAGAVGRRGRVDGIEGGRCREGVVVVVGLRRVVAVFETQQLAQLASW